MKRLFDWLWNEVVFLAENVRSELETWTAKVAVAGVAGLLFSVYLAIPVHFIPGNTLMYYLSIEPWWGFVLLAILAVEISLLITPRMLHADFEATGNALTDVSTAVTSFVPAVLACPILAVAALSFVLPATTIYSLVGSKWTITGVFAVVALGANYWKYSGCAKCQQWT
jgi:hypothetical protein